MMNFVFALVTPYVTGLKLFAGLQYGSSGLLADSLHSLSDVFSDTVTIVAARYSSAPADAKFPYGYGKYEVGAEEEVQVFEHIRLTHPACVET